MLIERCKMELTHVESHLLMWSWCDDATRRVGQALRIIERKEQSMKQFFGFIRLLQRYNL